MSPIDRLITRSEAEESIAAAYSHRTSFLIVVPPMAVASFGRSLADFPPDWTAYLDRGWETIAAVTNPQALESLFLFEQVIPVVGVVIVPKATPAGLLGKVLRADISPEKDDLIMLHIPGAPPYCWPMLLVNALGRVNPGMAVAILEQSQEDGFR